MGQRYAKLNGKVAVEILEVPDGATINDCMHPDLVKSFTPCGVNVTIGSTVDSNGTWTIAAPAEPVVSPDAKPEYEELTAMNYYLSFTVQERVAIKASTDPVVKEALATLELVMANQSTGSPHLVNPNRKSTQLFLAHLVKVGIIASVDRIAEISRGEIQ